MASFRTFSRMMELLEEVRGYTDLIGIRPINEYKEGKVQATGRHEFFCWHCAAVAELPSTMKHEPRCVMSRIDDALAEANRT